jgi:hypothetical protein
MILEWGGSIEVATLGGNRTDLQRNWLPQAKSNPVGPVSLLSTRSRPGVDSGIGATTMRRLLRQLLPGYGVQLVGPQSRQGVDTRTQQVGEGSRRHRPGEVEALRHLTAQLQ